MFIHIFFIEVSEAGFVVKETGEAVKDADVVMVLIPDEIQGDTYTNSIAPNLKKGAYLGFRHGFKIGRAHV